MKLLHQLGHNSKWNIDAYFDNNIGDGFLFSAFSFSPLDTEKKIKSFKDSKKTPLSLIDLQFYGSKLSEGGKLGKYTFHPISLKPEGETALGIMNCIQQAIDYQISIGTDLIVIPNVFDESGERTIEIASSASKLAKNYAGSGSKIFMSLPISGSVISDDKKIERMLTSLTDMDMKFDGYYIVCDANLGFKRKVSDSYPYYENLSRVFTVLKKQGFEIIYGLANIDALVFASIADIDYVTIGTYDNQRNFNIKRFTEPISGGPSDGWYFSEKLLGFVKAKEIDNLRLHGCLDLIRNDQNIFSDIILNDGYTWNTHKPDIHKNYLFSASNLLRQLSSIPDIPSRIKHTLDMTEAARKLYDTLASHKVYLIDESSGPHLSTWYAFLRSKL